jgi:hypothetical protein
MNIAPLSWEWEISCDPRKGYVSFERDSKKDGVLSLFRG